MSSLSIRRWKMWIFSPLKWNLLFSVLLFVLTTIWSLPRSSAVLSFSTPLVNPQESSGLTVGVSVHAFDCPPRYKAPHRVCWRIDNCVLPIAYNFDSCPSTLAVIQDLFLTASWAVLCQSGLAFSSAHCGRDNPPIAPLLEVKPVWKTLCSGQPKSLCGTLISDLGWRTLFFFFFWKFYPHFVNPRVTK